MTWSLKSKKELPLGAEQTEENSILRACSKKTSSEWTNESTLTSPSITQTAKMGSRKLELSSKENYN
jgi:hypothetical protein